MKRLLFIRHCHAEGQHKDSPLSKRGNKQAFELSNTIGNLSFTVDRIISSPYLRAKDSIKPFADRANLQIETDTRLEERMLSNEPIDDWIDILEQSFHNYLFKLPGGESSQEALNRANSVINECLNDANYQNIVIVTHGNLLALMLQRFQVEFGFHEWKSLTNPDMYLVQKIGGEFLVERIWDKNV